MIEQYLDRLHIARARRFHECSGSMQKTLVRVGSCLHERRCQDGVSVNAGQIERRCTLAVRGLDVRACSNQEVRHCLITLVHSPVKRRRAVRLGRIHIDVLRDEDAYSGSVAVHCGVCDVGTPRGRNHRR